jgi:hypothetical protein
MYHEYPGLGKHGAPNSLWKDDAFSLDCGKRKSEKEVIKFFSGPPCQFGLDRIL